jgi:hypothetical protein
MPAGLSVVYPNRRVLIESEVVKVTKIEDIVVSMGQNKIFK